MIKEAIDKIVEHLSPLSEQTRIDFEKRSTIESFEKGAILVKEGEYSDKLYFVLAGGIRAFYLKDGKDISDWFAFENHFVCAINSFFMEIPSPHFIEALEPTTTLTLHRDDVQELCDLHHDFERVGRLSVTATMLTLQQRIVGLQFETAQNRYDFLLNQYPFIEQRVPLGNIASYLGITQETLSRVRSNKKRI